MKFLKLILIVILFLFITPQVFAQLQTSSNPVKTRVGNPVDNSSAGWPVTVRSGIEQGINGIFDHHTLYDQGLQALDISSPIGTPIYTTTDGTVTTVCNDAQTSCGNYTGCNANGCGYGKHVVISSTVNGKNVTIFFGHFSQIDVAQGQTVAKGDQLGLMGTTGYSTGPHLHWEFRGFDMSPPNIPTAITPINCDNPKIPCTPAYIPDVNTSSTNPAGGNYWFLLHRQSNQEVLYTGTPGNISKSTLVKTFNVKTGRPGERPTPLPSLAGREYWVITEKHPTNEVELAPYFMSLDIPYDAPFYGPTPYNECNGQQCDWVTAGAFGLHGVNGNDSKLSVGDPGSSGCIRHSTQDITYLYNLLDPSAYQIRYYINDD